MRISDWSSDVCSSDLSKAIPPTAISPKSDSATVGATAPPVDCNRPFRMRGMGSLRLLRSVAAAAATAGAAGRADRLRFLHLVGAIAFHSGEIGRAACRERVCQYG